MAETDLSAWLLAMEAAMRIGCSTRTVERLGKAKQLEQRLRPQAGSPPVVVYNPDDVARVAAERRRDPAPFVLPAVPDSAPGNGHGRVRAHIESTLDPHGIQRASPAGDDPIRQLFAAALRAVLSPPSPPVAETVAERPVLTLDEAVAASGWSRTYLLRKIHTGTLKAEKDGGWKIRRKDLEKL
jgi:hypothetical protein